MAKYEKEKTKLCKYCQSEVPCKAKVCPHCQKKLKGGKLKWFIIVLIAILLIPSLGRKSTETDTPPKTVSQLGTANGSRQQSNQSSAPVKTEYSVGDTLQDGNLQIVYMSSGDYIEENQFSQPKDGYKYIYLQFAFINTSDKSDAHISSFNFSAYADGYAADMYFGGGDTLSATLSAGRSTSGYVYFTVPVDTSEIDVEYETNLFTEKKIHFIFEGEQNSGYVLEANSTAAENAYSVGDVVESSRLKITYLSCEEYISSNQFIQPKDGYHFISCEFEFENVGNSDEFISSGSFDCYADGVNCNASYLRDNNLSATLSAGRKTKGTVTFEVPVDAQVVEVEFLSNYWTSNRVVFSAN